MHIKRNSTLLSIICLAIVGLSACQSTKTEHTNAPIIPTPIITSIPEFTEPAAPVETLTLVPAAGTDEIRASLVNALLALYSQSNRMDVTTVLSAGQTSKNTIEFVPPDKKRIVDPGQSVEYIVIGEKVYAKNAGRWAETQIPASTFLGDGKVTADTLGSTLSNVQWVRKDTLDGLAVNVYRFNSTTQSSGIVLHNQTELWVGEEDGLPHKMIIDGEILSASTDPNTGESKLQAVKALTTTLVNFDPAITIGAPIP